MQKATQMVCLIVLLMLVTTNYMVQTVEIQASEVDNSLNHVINKRACVRSFGACSGIPRCCGGYCDKIGGFWGYCTC
jgi:hypothetical protein